VFWIELTQASKIALLLAIDIEMRASWLERDSGIAQDRKILDSSPSHDEAATARMTS